MSNSLSKYLFIIIVSFLSIFLVSFYVLAWTGPTANPPNENAATPLNVSNNAQTKTGPLGIDVNSLDTNYGLTVGTQNAANGLKVTGNSYLENNAYIMGNVGIGTTAPEKSLHIEGTSNTTLQIEGTQDAADVTHGELRFFSNKISSGDKTIGKITAYTQASGEIQERAGIDFVTQLGHGYYWRPPTDIVFKTNGDNVNNLQEAMRIRYNGNVGIGTTNPGYKLDVNGDANANRFCINGDCINSWGATGVQGSGTTNYVAKFTGSGTIGNSSIFDNGTNVGIGTTNPGAPLSVVAASSGDQALSQKWQYTSSDNYNLRLKQTVTSGVVRWTFDQKNNGVDYPNVITLDRGNVGIGTTNPGAKLEVNGKVRFLGSVGNTQFDGTGARIQFTRNSANYIDAKDTSGYLSFGTGGIANRVIIDSSGNVGIATTSPAFELDVNGQANATQLCINGDCKTSWSQVGTSYWSANGNNIYNTNSGNVGIGTTNPGAKLDVNGNIKTQKNQNLVYNTITIEGDADTYYPVTFDIEGDGAPYRINIFRVYTDQAPDTWYTSTHKGGLILTFDVIDHLWGGQPYVLDIEEFKETYSTQVANVDFTAHGYKVTVWLRGGGALYRLSGNTFSIMNPQICYSTCLTYDSLSNDNYDTSESPTTTVTLEHVDRGVIKIRGGNVGIGTTNPGYKLDVNGQANATQLCINGDCKSSWSQVGTSYWSANGNNIYNTNSGNVGIGTTNPSQKLDIAGGNLEITGTTGSPIADTFGGNTQQSYIHFPAASGSNDPGYIMHETRGDAETNEGVLHLAPSDDNVYGDYVSIHGTNDADMIKLHTSGDVEGVNTIGISISAERIDFDAANNQIEIMGGNVGIGTTNPAEKLEVNGTVKIQNFRIKQISSTELGFYDSDNNLVFEIDNGS